MPTRTKRRLWKLLEHGPGADGVHRRRRLDWFDWFITVLILLNVLALALESEPELERAYGPLFNAFEAFSLTVFVTEYALRLWACTVVGRYAHPVFGRLRYASEPMQIVDLLAILPAVLFFLPDLRFVRAVRLLRIVRVLKLGRYSEAVLLLGKVLRSRRDELVVMTMVLAVLLVVAASALHAAEAHAQPDKFGSVAQSAWWAVITLTTIGYGDVYPVTPLGKVLGGLFAIGGIGIVALPTAIIASAFSEELREAHERRLAAQAEAYAEAAAAAKAADPDPAAGSSAEAHGGCPPGHLACPHCGKPIALHASRTGT